MEQPLVLMPLRPQAHTAQVEAGIWLARKLEGKLAFLYVVEVPEYKGYPPGTMASSAINSIKEQKDAFYRHYQQILDEHQPEIRGSIDLEFMTVEATWVAGILAAAKQHQPDILLMSHEEKGLLDKILGESITEIIRNVDCPVWVLPAGKSIEKVDKVAFITNHSEGDMKVLGKLLELNHMLGSEITILDLVSVNDFESRLKKEGFQQIIEKDIPGSKLRHLELDDANIAKNAKEIIIENGFDALAVHNESEGSLARFFTRSSVEKLMDTVEIPLIVY